jgi:antitoxin Phd
MNWQLQEAKNKFSHVVKKAVDSGPQIITLRGKETAVLISINEYRKLTDKQESSNSQFKIIQ